jgi:hypothetical protein
VFSRMAVTLRNIHFGGALSGNAAIRFSQSMFCTLEPRSLPSQPAKPSEHRGEYESLLHAWNDRAARPPTTEQKVPHKRSEAPVRGLAGVGEGREPDAGVPVPARPRGADGPATTLSGQAPPFVQLAAHPLRWAPAHRTDLQRLPGAGADRARGRTAEPGLLLHLRLLRSGGPGQRRVATSGS